MSTEEFIELCEDKIREYINDSQTEYQVYILWKDHWMVGATLDAIESADSQRAIFGTTYNDAYYDITLNTMENKIYMKVYTITDNETYSTITSGGTK